MTKIIFKLTNESPKRYDIMLDDQKIGEADRNAGPGYTLTRTDDNRRFSGPASSGCFELFPDKITEPLEIEDEQGMTII